MEKETKYCVTAIIIAIIWFLAQPIGGNMSMSANLSNVPYFNLTNSTVSGSAEISGYFPMGAFIPLMVVDVMESDGAIFVYFTIMSLAIAFCIYKILTNRRN